MSGQVRIFRTRRDTIRGGHPDRIVPLAHMRPGETGRVVGVNAAGGHVLQKLLSLAVLPGSEVKLELVFPAFVFQVGNTRVAVDRAIAELILVSWGASRPGGSLP